MLQVLVWMGIVELVGRDDKAMAMGGGHAKDANMSKLKYNNK